MLVQRARGVGRIPIERCIKPYPFFTNGVKFFLLHLLNIVSDTIFLTQPRVSCYLATIPRLYGISNKIPFLDHCRTIVSNRIKSVSHIISIVNHKRKGKAKARWSTTRIPLSCFIHHPKRKALSVVRAENIQK